MYWVLHFKFLELNLWLKCPEEHLTSNYEKKVCPSLNVSLSVNGHKMHLRLFSFGLF